MDILSLLKELEREGRYDELEELLELLGGSATGNAMEGGATTETQNSREAISEDELPLAGGYSHPSPIDDDWPEPNKRV